MRSYIKTSVPCTLPCRFCKSTNTKIRHTVNRNNGRSGTMYAVSCGTCYARGPIVKDCQDRDPSGSILKAIELWNSVE